MIKNILLVFILFLLVGCITPTPTPVLTPTAHPDLDIKGWITFNREAPYIILSLCEIRYAEDGFRYCVYDPHEMWLKGLRVTPNELDGYFEFYNVPSGEWALVIDAVVYAVIPNYPDTSEPVIFMINGDIIILELYYSDPNPFPSFPPEEDPYPPPPTQPPYPNP